MSKKSIAGFLLGLLLREVQCLACPLGNPWVIVGWLLGRTKTPPQQGLSPEYYLTHQCILPPPSFVSYEQLVVTQIVSPFECAQQLWWQLQKLLQWCQRQQWLQRQQPSYCCPRPDCCNESDTSSSKIDISKSTAHCSDA